MLKKNSILLFLVLTHIAHISNGQQLGDIRFIVGYADLEDVVKIYRGGVCTATTHDIGSEGKIKFISDLGGNNYQIEIVRNNANVDTTDKYADPYVRYCISKADYDTNFSEKSASNRRKAYGFLAVPFKLRFGPTTVAPGGELGGFYGWYVGDSNWIFAPHAGLTFISLNDINSATPENKTGFTAGLALINDVAKNFQIGVVSGVDLFDGASEWPYGYEPWLSVQIGFKFTKE